jgi:prepilin signal peptidase PulO-like enzyme (type II secretory pathway)
MKLGRMRVGELLALLGAACILAAFTLPWYENFERKLDAFDTFGLAVVLLLLSAIVALVLVVSTVTERSTALPVAAAVWSTLLGLVAVIAAVVRLLERPDHATSLCSGAWLAFGGAVLIAAGSWESMRDERTRLYRPAKPEPRDPPAA